MTGLWGKIPSVVELLRHKYKNIFGGRDGLCLCLLLQAIYLMNSLLIWVSLQTAEIHTQLTVGFVTLFEVVDTQICDKQLGVFQWDSDAFF